jgi:enamine deaminase RidA (YjgF/YER057c/UK114 family)
VRERKRVSSGGRWEPLVGYSRAVRVGDTAYVSGCTAAGLDGQVQAPGDMYGQTMAAIRTLERALRELGLGLEHVVKTGVYLADMDQWEGAARAHRELFGAVRPACTWVEVGKMIHPEMLVEIDAVAAE